MGYTMGLHLCDVKIWGLKFLNLVAKSAKLLSSTVNYNCQQSATVNNQNGGSVQQKKKDNKGPYTFAGSMPWMNKNNAVSDKSFAIAVMKV